ncbi:MAG: hypothetical protein ABSG65_30505 [Bryobacteraceae bacterium]
MLQAKREMKNADDATETSRREPRAFGRGGAPAEATNLSPVERDLLPDPDWVTEDDADAIIALRRQGERPISLEQALKKYGSRRLAR